MATAANQTPRIILGSAAILAGLLLTLRNLGIPGIDDLLDCRPVVLVAVYLSACSCLGGAVQRSTSQSFRGMANMGGVEIRH